jgi:hypothetical protein
LPKLLPCLALLSACASGPAIRADEDLLEGDVEAVPAMTVLPSTDVELTALTEKMQFAWSLAEESFESAMPPAPPSVAGPEYQQWVEEDLRNWVRRKTRAVIAARRELDDAADENLRQRIFAGAIVGLMYEDVAMSLRSIPTPAALDDEPEIAQIFREVLDGHAAPFVAHADRAYRACALNADSAAPSLRHWRSFCLGRRENLPTREEVESAPLESDDPEDYYDFE